MPRLAVRVLGHRIGRIALALAALAAILCLTPGVARASVYVGVTPQAVALNDATNKLYVTNNGSNTVSIVDGATNAVTTVAVGSQPSAIAVNKTTNKVYVACGDGTVWIIDGATNDATSIALEAYDIAVNETTNKIYVASGTGLDVIDGSTNGVTPIAMATSVSYVAVNAVTNKIYALSSNYDYDTDSESSVLGIIDGLTGAAKSIGFGSSASGLAVNTATNKVYAFGNDSGEVTILDGVGNGVSSVSVGADPSALVANSVTGKVYVVRYSGTLSIIDGPSNAVSSVKAGSDGWRVALNTKTNKVLTLGSSLGIVDGATKAVSTVSIGPDASLVAVNEVTNRAFVVSDPDNGEVGTVASYSLDALLSKATVTVYPKSTTTLKYIGGSGSVTWKSSNRAIATVSSKGVVTGVKLGTATITAKRNGISLTCKVTVAKRSYKLSLSRSVSSGHGYINATVKTTSGSAVKYKRVKFYRSGSYIGAAKTGSTGKAKLRVKKYYSDKTYKIVAGGTSTYKSTSKSEVLSFTYLVYEYEGNDLWNDSVYLRAGHYRAYMYGDGNVYGTIGNDAEVVIDGYDGDYGDFTVYTSDDYDTYGASMEDQGFVRMEIWRRL